MMLAFQPGPVQEWKEKKTYGMKENKAALQRPESDLKVLMLKLPYLANVSFLIAHLGQLHFWFSGCEVA